MLIQTYLQIRCGIGSSCSLDANLTARRLRRVTTANDSSVMACATILVKRNRTGCRSCSVDAAAVESHPRSTWYAEDSPAANLYVSMLDAFGTPVERFADSTGPLRGVLA